MPNFVGNQDDAKDGTSNTLMIGEVVHAATDDAGAQFYSRENAASGDIGHADLLFGADSPLSKDPGIAWVSGEGGTRGGTSILEFAVENHPNNAGRGPGDDVLVFSHEANTNDSIWIDLMAPVMRAPDGRRGYVLTQPEHAATNAAQMTLHSEVFGPQTGGWITDVTYERFDFHPAGEALGGSSASHLSHLLYQDLVII